MISVRGLRFAYPGEAGAALDGVDLDVSAGDRVLVAGASGSGKSTLLRAINGLVPHFYGGRFGGRVIVDGMDTRLATPRQLASRVGTVFQDSRARFLTSTVGEEVAFSLELAGASPADIRRRTAEILERMGLAGLEIRRPDHLSAGEQARVGIAVALGRDPASLVLDEPVTHLDPEGARAVVRWVGDLCREAGLTTVLAEHRLEAWRGEIDRSVFLNEGRVGPEVVAPHTAHDGEALLPLPRVPAAILRAEGLRVSFDGRLVLDGIDLSVEPGEVVGLVGRNGSGKTTLLRCLAGLHRPDDGAVTLDGFPVAGPTAHPQARIGYVPQPPSKMLFAETVRDEVIQSRPAGGDRRMAPDAGGWIEAFGLASLADRHPRDLSAGERERVALAAVLAARPSIVLLDEPTLGMDGRRLAWLRRMLEGLGRSGTAIIVATHDAAFVAEAAGRAVLLDRGRIVADGRPADVLESDPVFGPGLASAAPAATVAVA